MKKGAKTWYAHKITLITKTQGGIQGEQTIVRKLRLFGLSKHIGGQKWGPENTDFRVIEV